MWEKYKSAFITGAVLCCIIFFGLGYCVGNSGRGYHGGIQNAGYQSMERGNSGMMPGGRNHLNRPDATNPQNPTENEDQSNDGSQTAPDSNSQDQTTPGTNGGNQTTPGTNGGNQTTPGTDATVYIFEGTDVF